MDKNLPEKYRESLQAIFIRRAYWAMNSVHNKVFFNEAGKTYAVPDREDKIVAMLTEQDPNEVALLRLTREILKKAEGEQPEKKLSLAVKSQEVIKEAERKPTQHSQNEEQQLTKELNKRESIRQEQKRKENIEGKSESIEEQQRETNTLQEGKQTEVSIERNNKSLFRHTIQKQEIGKQKEATEQEDVEMDGKQSRQNMLEEESERQKRRKQETEEEIDIVGIALEQSIWAPSRRNCDRNNSLIANIPAYDVPGKTEEERVKFIRWSLKNNTHVKGIKEAFKRGNLWIEVVFDCKYGREEAIQRISKKESDWYKMIPEEEEGRKDKKGKQRDFEEEQQSKGTYTSSFRKEKCESDISRREPNDKKYEEKGRFNNMTDLTIWDLPANINRREVEYICRRIKNVRIVCIKRFKYKALAVIQAQDIEEEDIPWSLPADNNKLVRVTKGKEDHEAREEQRRHTAKLTELPGNASEVLLLRCLRSKGAKSVYIPPNRNGNQRRTALITFASEEDMKAAQSKPIMYNNFRVYWVNERKSEPRRRESLRKERGRSWDRLSQTIDTEEDRSRGRSQENKIYTKRRGIKEDLKPEAQIREERSNSPRQSTKNQRRFRSTDEEEEDFKRRNMNNKTQQQEKDSYIEDILGRILERLGKLEEIRDPIREDIAKRS